MRPQISSTVIRSLVISSTVIRLTIIGLTLLFSPSLLAQEAAPEGPTLSIKRPEYRVGQTFIVDERGRQDLVMDLRLDGNNTSPAFEQQVRSDARVRYEVLAVEQGRVTRCRVRVARLDVQHLLGNNPANEGVSLAGKVYLYERLAEDKRRASCDGKELGAREIGRIAALLPLDPLEPGGPWRGRLPERPLRIGETITCPREALPRFDLALGIGLKVSDIELTLLRRRPHEGRPCALFAVTIRSELQQPIAYTEIDTRFRIRGVLLLDLATGAERLLTVSGPLRIRGSQSAGPQSYVICGDGRLKLRRSLAREPGRKNGAAKAAPRRKDKP